MKADTTVFDFAALQAGKSPAAFRRMSRAVIICALCISIGSHWAALQSAAWALMIVQYSQHVSLAKAVAQTFDGEHPCGLCKTISAAQHSQKKPAAQQVTIKPDLICTTRAIALRPRCTPFPFVKVDMSASALVYSPPVPPPRTERV